MGKFRVTAPDGKTYDVEAPEGASEAEVMAYVQQNTQAAPVAEEPSVAGVESMSGTEKFMAGTGRGIVNTARGVRQIGAQVADAATGGLHVAPGVSQQGRFPRSEAIQSEIDVARQLDAPLLATGAGMAGNVAGTASTMIPLMAIPGANTVAGASLIGGASGFVGTPGTVQERGQAAAFGAGGGGLGLLAGRGIAAGGRALLNRSTATGAREQIANQTRDIALVEGQRLGLTVPPATANPTLLNKTAEGFAGKLSTAQKASNLNAPEIDAAARRVLALQPDTPLTPDTFNAVRAVAGQAYEAVSNTGMIRPSPAYSAAIDKILQPFKTSAKGFPNSKANPIVDELEALKSPEFDAASAVAKIRELRDAADSAYRSGSAQIGRAYKDAAKALESSIDEHLTVTGAPRELLDGYRSARELIAKTYTVQGAMDGGTVSGAKLASMLSRNKPLSGDLKAIALFSDSFKKAVQTPAKVGTVAGTSPLDWFAASMAALHNPMLIAGVAARPAVRNAILSKSAQRLLATPRYGPNALNRGVVNALEQPTTQNALSRLSAAKAQQE